MRHTLQLYSFIGHKSIKNRKFFAGAAAADGRKDKKTAQVSRFRMYVSVFRGADGR